MNGAPPRAVYAPNRFGSIRAVPAGNEMYARTIGRSRASPTVGSPWRGKPPAHTPRGGGGGGGRALPPPTRGAGGRGGPPPPPPAGASGGRTGRSHTPRTTRQGSRRARRRTRPR